MRDVLGVFDSAQGFGEDTRIGRMIGARIGKRRSASQALTHDHLR
jgi:hypothetical protein